MEKHTFHIPVMGIGYTADSPLKVAAYGINSVISLVDDILLEKLRKYYSEINKLKYIEISDKTIDYRALRITAYLNLMQDLIEAKIEKLKNISNLKEDILIDYIKHLPTNSELKKRLLQSEDIEEVRSLIKYNLRPGRIDVNIMTKIDKTNYIDHEALPVEYNDAHAALRGYANANITSSIVFSAGMNPRLYNYLENFEDFYPDASGFIKKKIILKVSDYRSALIQGKYLAKKGLWVSEYRIESGLNCGGHAFATEGYLLGPVLEEFKKNKKELYNITHSLFINALESKNKERSFCYPDLKISAQGGVGTAEEHQFLLKHYELDSIGWGSPFLLVPEATTVDVDTIDKLANAQEKDLYLSNISPLGIPFNNLRGNTKDEQKQIYITKNRPGSACPKKHVALNQEFKKEGQCTASREYQYLKIKQLKADDTLSPIEQQKEIDKVTEKSCICVGLGTTALLAYNIETKTEGKGVSVCPGPNLAYFTEKVSLTNMIDHIYGKINIIKRNDRPNMFIKELDMYVTYLSTQINEQFNPKQNKTLIKFTNNLLEGINYYQELFQNNYSAIVEQNKQALENLSDKYQKVIDLQLQLQRT
ncbi:hypothetical protein [Wenyingzhuangia marina]|uniref:Uncharacterized protein n=1 Tax=Wenyingzhuangia marina TaxID=1195760 RepID=A0A1M5VHG2_9FLAO|nr:hypothetical protein [Wenyingzhuangia marina]GGF72177.1 hypothetical protein GCM10011397_13840 [Wenyingzhuangia marina]SHH74615.1 hypothetical protein SAMN05444281_1800 [Wenyingzhuangia marina]